jgi:uncharacterized RDD family membrane protein YckC
MAGSPHPPPKRIASPAPLPSQLGPPTCPICLQPRKETAFAKLFDVRVCKKCKYKFANRRQGAYLFDWLVLTILTYMVNYGLDYAFSDFLYDDDNYALTSFWFFYSWILWPLLFTLKDGFAGQSPGKWLTGVRAVDAHSREPIGFVKSWKRNLVTIVPFLPLFIAFQLQRGRRWGDRWAGTEVVWIKHQHRVPFDRRGILCLGCGYDLTGNVSGRCPECGLIIHKPSPMHPAEHSVALTTDEPQAARVLAQAPRPPCINIPA